ncbi:MULTISPECIES: hypothetical protein [unclassified Kitasatospora]|uniref:hypothetical protein n=1 Tax=unclassified Kitasatospora TaxID=2633591 RepID=UPI00070F1CFC|nr:MULTISPECIES: hypothetical protein [unclassified Kitasatospora]KQV21692.1 hypothetical protein ASC99_18455 [Kitasatospora sp. Root107]KRB75517.1 hypothetical protein ASE03_16300 [Kitasatospora sp. Root187]
MTALDVLTEFGRTGLIGPVGCRVPLPELAAALGPPWVGDPVDKRWRWPHWFGYGDLQLVVCRCRLVTMVIVPAWHGEVEYPVAAPSSRSCRSAQCSPGWTLWACPGPGTTASTASAPC